MTLLMEEAILMLRKAQENKEIQQKKCKTAMNVQASWRVSTILTIILQYTKYYVLGMSRHEWFAAATGYPILVKTRRSG